MESLGAVAGAVAAIAALVGLILKWWFREKARRTSDEAERAIELANSARETHKEIQASMLARDVDRTDALIHKLLDDLTALRELRKTQSVPPGGSDPKPGS